MGIPETYAFLLCSCRAFNKATHLGAWIFYAISIIYDVGITVLSIFYLLKYKLVMKNTMLVACSLRFLPCVFMTDILRIQDGQSDKDVSAITFVHSACGLANPIAGCYMTALDICLS